MKGRNINAADELVPGVHIEDQNPRARSAGLGAVGGGEIEVVVVGSVNGAAGKGDEGDDQYCE